MHRWPRADRAWLSLFSAAYGVQQLSTLHSHQPNALIDLRIFFAASRAAAHGGNPYAPHALVATEHQLFPTYLPLQGHQALALPYMHGPLPLLLLRPFATWNAAVVVPSLMGLGAVLLVACRALGAAWPGRGWGLFVVMVAGLPGTIQELALGQLTLVVLAGMAGGLVLSRRGHMTAGAIVAVLAASMKPHLGVLALCGAAAGARWRLGRPMYSGLLLGGLALLAAAWLSGGAQGVTSWLVAPFRFGVDGSVGQQMDLLSLPALAGRLLPYPAAPIAAGLAAAVWAGGLAWLWRRLGGNVEAWLAAACVSWPLAAPYSHTSDLVMTTPALWWLWRRAERGRRDLFLLAAAYAALWSDAPLHTAFPAGTLLGQWAGLPCAIVLCAVVVASLCARPGETTREPGLSQRAPDRTAGQFEASTSPVSLEEVAL